MIKLKINKLKHNVRMNVCEIILQPYIGKIIAYMCTTHFY